MLRKILLHGLFFALPFIVYALWFWYERRRARLMGTAGAVSWRDAPLVWLTTAGLVLMIISFFAVSQVGRFEPGGTYTAPRLGEDGEVIPAETE